MQNVLLITPSPSKSIQQQTYLNLAKIASKRFLKKINAIENKIFALDDAKLTSIPCNCHPSNITLNIIKSKSIKLDDKSQSNSSTSIIRRSYKKYSDTFKEMCIELCKTKPVTEISKLYNIPKRSLQRWIRVGIGCRRFCGRKVIDPEMEKKLVEWCAMYEENNPIRIRLKALEFTSNSKFKASKGWFEKFKRKHKDLFCK
jgi:hypothetical protein